MVRLRLRRVGKKKQPTYRLVAIHKQASRDGKYIEYLGYYNPRPEPVMISFKEERVLDWLRKGALPSNTVMKLLEKIGLWEKFQQTRKVEEELETTQEA